MKVIEQCLEMQPRTSYMRRMRSTTELHPLLKKSPFCFCRFTNTTNPVVVNYQEKSEIISHENHRTFLGDAGDWIQDLIHAKHALFHWATSPLNENPFCFCRFKNTINPVVGNYQDISEIILLKFAWKSSNISWRCWGLNPGPHTCKAGALPLSFILCSKKVLSVSVDLQIPQIQLW